MITYRPATEADSDLVFGAWMRKHKVTLRMGDFINNSSYYESLRLHIATLLAAHGALVAEAEGAALGFIVASDAGVVHWLHVKPEFRRLGIGTELVRIAMSTRGAARIEFASPTPFIRTVRDKITKETYYNPFAGA